MNASPLWSDHSKNFTVRSQKFVPCYQHCHWQACCLATKSRKGPASNNAHWSLWFQCILHEDKEEPVEFTGKDELSIRVRALSRLTSSTFSTCPQANLPVLCALLGCWAVWSSWCPTVSGFCPLMQSLSETLKLAAMQQRVWSLYGRPKTWGPACKMSRFIFEDMLIKWLKGAVSIALLSADLVQE